MTQQPDEKDAVLGGQTPAPIDSVILGGIEGLRQRFAIAPSLQKPDILHQALNYGEIGIDLLVDAVNDAELPVRATACQLLSNVESRKAKRAIAKGVPLNPGDQIDEFRQFLGIGRFAFVHQASVSDKTYFKSPTSR